jgi:cyclic-di-GMP-binding protein
MALDCSFDVVSKTDMQEVQNAVQQARREIETRFDFKGSKSEVNLNLSDNEIVLISDDEGKLRSVKDVLETRLVKRQINLKALDYQKLEDAALGTVRQRVKIIQGIDSDRAKAIVRTIKDAKLKVQAAIQGDQVRVSGKKKDLLQEAIALLKEKDFGAPLQFVNFRG